MSSVIQFKKVDDRAILPFKTHDTDAGLDITVIKKIKTDQYGCEWYDTGLQLATPPGYYTELMGRSSLIKHGRQLANCVGIIDETYRGNLMVVLVKLHPDALALELPARVCQLIMREGNGATAKWVTDLDATGRGFGGFGSTGEH
jgi:dUTP pyrophosphatase